MISGQQRATNFTETEAQRLIADLEALRLRLKDGIDRKYRASKHSWSYLWGLLYAAAYLARLQPTSEMLHVGGDLFTQMPAQGGPLNPAACKRLAMTSS